MGQFTCFGTMDPQIPVVEEEDTGEEVVAEEEEGQGRELRVQPNLRYYTLAFAIGPLERKIGR